MQTCRPRTVRRCAGPDGGRPFDQRLRGTPRPENITGAESRPCTATAAPAYGRFQQAEGAFAEIGSVAGLGAGGAGIRSRADADRDLVPEGGGLVLLVEEGKAEHVEAFQTASRRARSSLSAATARLVTTVRPTRSTVTPDGLPCPDIRAWEADWPMINSLWRGPVIRPSPPVDVRSAGVETVRMRAPKCSRRDGFGEVDHTGVHFHAKRGVPLTLVKGEVPAAGGAGGQDDAPATLPG